MAAKKNVSARKPSARKRARQTIKTRALNFSQRSAIRTAVKKVRAAVGKGDSANAKVLMVEAVPTLDSLARKGIIHRNKAARLKSRLARALKTLASAA
jgi:small subunit ribosomal protein S20